MRTIAVLGIDGSGKSTIIKQLHSYYAHDNSYHDLPGSGHDDLSAAFEKLNSLGNSLQLTDLKALGLYLQMSLYGPVQQHLSSCQTIISERHGLIDTLIYGTVYSRQIKGHINQQEWETRIRMEMEQFHPRSFENVLDWIDHLNGFTPQPCDFWNYTGFLKSLFNEPKENIITRLSNYLQVQMPNEIFFIDVDPDEAFDRLQSRKKNLELHETRQLLNLFRGKYVEFFHQLQSSFPHLSIHILTDNIIDNIKSLIKSYDTHYTSYEN
jgi:thymidylate kinase